MAQSSSLSFTAGHRLLDPSMHGLGLLRELAGRFWSADLDLTRLGSLVALAGFAPAAWRLLRGAWHEAYGWVQQFFLATVTIPGRDPLNRNVMAWVLAHVIEPRRNIRSVTARTRAHAADNTADPRAAQLKKTRREVQYLPHFETTWFWHEGSLFTIRRSLDVFHAAMGDPAYEGIGGEELTIGCIGRSTAPAKRLIQSCREYADAQAQYFIIIYSPGPLRHVVAAQQELLADIRKYLDPKTKRRYQGRSMPYRRGYLFYGPPGTGKSSLSTALAGEFGLDLYEVKMPSVAADHDLEQMFQEIPPQCIVLLEDIDAVTPLLVGEIHRLATDFARHIPNDTFTPSQLQGFFQLYLDSAVDAAANIAPWVERELARRSRTSNIEIVKDKNTNQ
ncbi:ATPase [Apiospora phragmitis]|uniref:ATPase n=1 Tax=Apiospora phragmitis TaxID=2905665 RepID=A0ABR1VIV4_9PEZI